MTWTAGALLIVGLVAGTVLSVVPDGMVNGAASVTTTTAEPEPSATPTPSKTPKATKKTPAAEPTLRYPSCNDVWAARFVVRPDGFIDTAGITLPAWPNCRRCAPESEHNC